MKNSGLKNEQKVQELLTKGSNALGEKNSAGVRLFKESDLGDGIISGKLIRPKYNNDELKKSIDTEIFELLPQESPQLPDTVLRSVYNVATQSINDLTLQVQRLTNEVSTLSSKVSELEIVSESLKIEADNQILRANISENQTLIANEQVATTTIDLQNAIQNSINEAIERVSISARLEALQESFRVQKELTEQREKENAAQTSVEGLNGFFEQTANVGWKINPSDVFNDTKFGLYIKTENDNKVNGVNGPRVAFFNFTTEEQTFTLSYSGTFGGKQFIEGPSSFKVPPRNENVAGVTTAEFRFRAVDRTSKRNLTGENTITINTSSGDKLTLKAYYEKEVKRKDKWGTRFNVKTFVGEDKTEV